MGRATMGMSNNGTMRRAVDQPYRPRRVASSSADAAQVEHDRAASPIRVEPRSSPLASTTTSGGWGSLTRPDAIREEQHPSRPRPRP